MNVVLLWSWVHFHVFRTQFWEPVVALNVWPQTEILQDNLLLLPGLRSGVTWSNLETELKSHRVTTGK